MVLLVPTTTTATCHSHMPPARGLTGQEPPGSPGNRNAEEIAAEMGRHVEGKRELRATYGLLRVRCPSSVPPLQSCVPRMGQLAQLLESTGWKKLLAVSRKWLLLPALRTSPWFFPSVLPCSISAKSMSSLSFAAAM